MDNFINESKGFKFGTLKKPPIVIKEGEIVSGCIQWLWHNGCFTWRHNTGGYKTPTGGFVRFGLKGSADIVGVTPSGRFIAVECKRPGKRQEPEQIEFQRKIEEKKGIYILAYSVDDLIANREKILGEDLQKR